METEEERFLRELKRELKRLPNRADIMSEYESHLYELSEFHDYLTYDFIVEQLGEPKAIAHMWKKESKITASKMQWLFVILNGLIFVGGGFLTLGYQLFHWTWLDQLWQFFISVPFLLLAGYLLFWALVGYEIGREFGPAGQKLLKRTFLIAIIPNFILMYLVVFKILPYEWFDSLLTPSFITLCIVLTAFIYPVSYLGYRFGKRASL